MRFSFLIKIIVFLWVTSVDALEPRVVKVGSFNYYPGIFKDTVDGKIRGSMLMHSQK